MRSESTRGGCGGLSPGKEKGGGETMFFVKNTRERIRGGTFSTVFLMIIVYFLAVLSLLLCLYSPVWAVGTCTAAWNCAMTCGDGNWHYGGWNCQNNPYGHCYSLSYSQIDAYRCVSNLNVDYCCDADLTGATGGKTPALYARKWCNQFLYVNRSSGVIYKKYISDDGFYSFFTSSDQSAIPDSFPTATYRGDVIVPCNYKAFSDLGIGGAGGYYEPGAGGGTTITPGDPGSSPGRGTGGDSGGSDTTGSTTDWSKQLDFLQGIQKNTKATADDLVLVEADLAQLKQVIAGKGVGGGGGTTDTGVSTAVTGLGTKLDTVNTNLGTVNTKLTTENTNSGTIATNTGNIKTGIDGVNTKLTTENTNSGTIATNTGNIKTGIDGVNTKLITENTNSGTIATNTGNIKTGVDTVNTKLDSIKTGIDNLNSAVSDIPHMGSGNLPDGGTSEINDDSLYNAGAVSTYTTDAQNVATSFLDSFLSSNPIISWVQSSGVTYGSSSSSVSFSYNGGQVNLSAIGLGAMIDANGIGTFFMGLCSLAGLISILRD